MDNMIAWSMIILMLVISIVLLSGRGSFLIAGYNTASKEEKAKYNEKNLCRVVGGALSIFSAIMGVFTFYDFEMPSHIAWLMPWGLFGVVIIMMILTNTVCKAKKNN